MNLPIVPRQVIFGNPDHSSPQISPDGRYIAWLAPDEGVLNVYVAERTNPAEARVVTSDRTRGVRNFSWAYTSRNILYAQDEGGDENWHIHQVDVETKEDKDLTPEKAVQAQILQLSKKYPSEALFGLNIRSPQFHDIYRVNILTGERHLILQNDEWASIDTDDDMQVRFGARFESNGDVVYKKRTDDGWESFLTIPHEDTQTTQIVGFNKTNDVAYMLESRGRDTGAFATLDLKSGKLEVLAGDERADASGLLIHPEERTVQAVAFNYDRIRWQVLDESIQVDLDALKAACPGEIYVLSRSMDDRWWTVEFNVDNGPARFYLYEREAKKATFLFTNRADLEKYSFTQMQPVVIDARDGLKLVSYLSLPAEGSAPFPMVLLVHGGPWYRDSWGFHGIHQWLCNRGYAVLSVNFRGSTGFGKAHVNAGDLEWGAKMHDDLIDAVDWAVREGHAIEDKVAIMGGSYGGYATLAGMVFTPEKFVCGVDIVGPSSLFTLIKSIPPYWEPMVQIFKDRMGNPDTEQGRKLLEERSPLNFVDRIKRPLLIAQGANDPRVKQAESDQIVAAMQEKSIPVTYILFPDEGHGFARPENDLSFYACTEAFLAEHLGGRTEPIGNDFSNSSIQIPAGEDQLPGVKEALSTVEG